MNVTRSEATRIRIFAHGLVRWGGLSFARIEELSHPDLLSAWMRCEAAQEVLAAARARLCDAIAALVPHVPSPALRGELIALKRAVYRRRAGACERVRTFITTCDASALPRLRWTALSEAVEEEARLGEGLEQAGEDLASAFVAGRSNVRRRLAELLDEPWFSRGLEVASPDMMNRLRKTAPRLREDSQLGRSEQQVELTLLRYATRAGAKTSPFSSLGAVAWVRWGEPATESVRAEVRRVVRFNQRRLAAWIARARQDPDCRRSLLVEPNPTLCLDGKTHSFFAPPDAAGRERFCQLPSHPVVSRVLAMLEEGPVPFAALAARLGPELTETEGTRWIAQLLHLGVLQWSVLIPGDDWLDDLIAEPAFVEKQGELERLRADQAELASGSPAERAAARQDAELRLPEPNAGASERDDGEADRGREPLLFEDCYVEGTPTVPSGRFESWARSLDRLVQVAAFCREDEPALARTFREQFGPHGRAPLLELAKHHTLRRRSHAPIRSGVDAARLFDAFDRCVRREGEALVHVRSEELAGSVSSSRRVLAHASLSAFLQVSGDGTRAVHNGVLAGHGRAFSRFLHSRAQLAAALRDENRRSCGDDLCAEITASSLFNGNVHPPLADYELILPGGPRAYPRAARIRPSELEVVGALEDGLLRVRHVARGRGVRLLWLGFEATDRSGLMNVLKELALDYVPDPRQLLGPLNRWWVQRFGGADESAARRLPRVVVDDGLVLQRTTWVVPRALLPTLSDSADGYTDLQFLRARLGLPRRLFFTAIQLSDLQRLDEAQRRRLRADDRKPQYVDLGSPWAVPLLRLAFSRCPRSAVFVEMDPGEDRLQSWGDAPRVSECVVQWARDRGLP